MQIRYIGKAVLLVSLFAIQVAAQTPTRIVLAPLELTLAVGQTQQVVATVYDQNNQIIANANPSWLPIAGMPSCVRAEYGMVTGILPGQCGVSAVMLSGALRVVADKPVLVTVIQAPVSSEFTRFEVLGKTVNQQDDILTAAGDIGYGSCWVFTQSRYFYCVRPKNWTTKYEFMRWPFPNGQQLRDDQATQVSNEGYSNIFVWSGQLRASRPKVSP